MLLAEEVLKSRRNPKHHPVFIHCLENMAIIGEGSDLLSYAKNG